jgi:hypothetical protein
VHPGVDEESGTVGGGYAALRSCAGCCDVVGARGLGMLAVSYNESEGGHEHG